MSAPQRSPQTRERLLEIAAEVFAEQGYHNARVREICGRAEANVAAVHYHFGDKERLYDEVLRYAFFGLTGADPTDWGVGEDAEPEEQLHSFARTLLSQLLGEGRSVLYAKLVAREMMEPTHALEHVIDAGIRPQIESLSGVIRSMLGDGATEPTVRRCAASIVGQCLFYYFARAAIVRLPLEDRLGPTSIDALADHITRFSVAALGQLGSAGETDGQGEFPGCNER